MAGEPFHKTGVTVPAAMAAPHIGINAVIKTADARFGENRFGEDFSYLHRKYYNGVVDKPKGLKWQRTIFAVATLRLREIIFCGSSRIGY
jgi:hypothetical protein